MFEAGAPEAGRQRVCFWLLTDSSPAASHQPPARPPTLSSLRHLPLVGVFTGHGEGGGGNAGRASHSGAWWPRGDKRDYHKDAVEKFAFKTRGVFPLSLEEECSDGFGRDKNAGTPWK